ncbi:MAG: sulfotransferase [Pseudomonadota bacterium]
MKMQRKFHFVSGLPRSGSTLMGALLRQNPRFHAGMSSPVASLTEGLIGQVSAGSELSTMVSESQRERLIRGLFESYYAESEAEIIFDTNRAWTAQLPLLMRLYPEAKLICTVRNVAWVMDSLERQFRDNIFEHTRLFNTPAERSTVYTRLEALAHPNRLVGYAWHALQEAVWSEHADRIIIVDYDILAARPAEVMPLIYQFIEESAHDHDFSAVDYDAPEFDSQLGVRGLHKVHKEVAPRPRKTVLPPDLFKRYAGLSFWTDIKGSKAYKIVPQQVQTDAPRGNEEA